MLAHYETECVTTAGTEQISHHKGTEQAQKPFLVKDENKLRKVMTYIENPFQEESGCAFTGYKEYCSPLPPSD